jgi:predicted acetyltransferase
VSGSRPQVELSELSPDDTPLLERLGQLYQYDFSEFDGSLVGEDGRFGWVDWPKFFSEVDAHAFLVRVDGQIAGFAAVYRCEAYRDADEQVWWMDNFFVMRSYRQLGVGERVVLDLFARFRGTWEIAQLSSNVAAQAFWRTTLGRYASGEFDEIVLSDDRWHGPVQYVRTTP